VLANSGHNQTTWRTVAQTPHTATIPSNKTDNKHLPQSKNTLEPYTKPTRPKAGATSSVIMMSSLRRFSRRNLKDALVDDDCEDPDTVPTFYDKRHYQVLAPYASP
jgi:hypothetical protein